MENESILPIETKSMNIVVFAQDRAYAAFRCLLLNNHGMAAHLFPRFFKARPIGFSVFIAIRVIEIHIFLIISRNGDAVFAVRNLYRSAWRFPCLHVVNWRKAGGRNDPNWIAFFKLLINSGNTFSSQI